MWLTFNVRSRKKNSTLNITYFFPDRVDRKYILVFKNTFITLKQISFYGSFKGFGLWMSLNWLPEAGVSRNLPIYNVNLYDQVRESYSHNSESYFCCDMTDNQYLCSYGGGRWNRLSLSLEAVFVFYRLKKPYGYKLIHFIDMNFYPAHSVPF